MSQIDTLDLTITSLVTGSGSLLANSSRRDLNSGRRTQNGIVVDEDKPLNALYSIRTGQLIPDFPKNLRALDELPGE